MSKTITTLSILGVLFSGYLSVIKLISGECAFNETCPYFLGYPSCYFGFVLFLALTITAALWSAARIAPAIALPILMAVSGLGILFAGYFTIGELPSFFEQGFSVYVLGLPTCALGLIFFAVIFALAVRERARITKLFIH